MLPSVLFVLLTINLSICIHIKYNNVLAQCVIASLLTLLVYQIIGIMIFGYLDLFAVFALIIGAGFAFVLSMLVRVVMSLIMRKSLSDGDNQNNL
jgi:hypothetical protein